uniref:Probable tubulin polyglutamylase TTLL1 n=1 Tax=Phallusia mammillata TaxID=59560 RepID=A0A6F9DWF6_9ASCI|nr:probable tubulin polyglutamylase TTLL1 [Phallusia mammillata]
MVLHNTDDGLVLKSSEHVPEVLKQILTERGWNEVDEDSEEKNNGAWNLWWKTQRFRKSEHDEVEPWQRLNHFPRTDAITRKDSLVRNLRRMRCIHGAQVFNFHPAAYILPNEYTKFVSDYAKESQKYGKKNLFWICKPVDLSRGRGIFVFHDLKHLAYDCSVVVQRYISNPYLISGYKFDLRIYVCVPSFQPLTIYMYQEGIARFSTDKFDLNQLNNVFSHLTNTSINKYGPAYSTDKERVGPGCKWTLSQLRSFLRQSGDIDETLLWMRISNIITLTLATQAPSVPKCSNCFEVFGFDILVDDNMKPWLLEVNFSPALSMDCQADFIAKRSMLNDLIDLLNFKETDTEHGGLTHREEVTPTPGVSRSLYGGPEVFTSLTSSTQSKSQNTVQPSPTRPLSRRTAVSRQSKHSTTSVSSLLPVTGKRTRAPLTKEINVTRPFTTLPQIIPGSSESIKDTNSQNDLPRNASSGSLSSSVSSVDHSNQPENAIDSENPQATTNAAVTPTPSGKKRPVDEISKSVAAIRPKRKSGSLTTITEIKNDQNQAFTNKTSVKAAPFSKFGMGREISNSPTMFHKRKTPTSTPRRVTSAYLPKSSKQVLSGNGAKPKKNSSDYKSPYSIASTAPKRITQENLWPRTRVGDFVLTFPLNEAMRKASGNMFDMKTIIREQQKIMKKLLVGSGQRLADRRRSSTDLSDTDALQLKFQLMFDDKDANPLYFWGPQNPPLLSTVLS